jgi:hypothetical protein
MDGCATPELCSPTATDLDSASRMLHKPQVQQQQPHAMKEGGRVDYRLTDLLASRNKNVIGQPSSSRMTIPESVSRYLDDNDDDYNAGGGENNSSLANNAPSNIQQQKRTGPQASSQKQQCAVRPETQISLLQIEVEDKRKIIESLKNSLDDQRKKFSGIMRDNEKIVEKALAAAKEESDKVADRHLKLIDRLIHDKNELTKK